MVLQEAADIVDVHAEGEVGGQAEGLGDGPVADAGLALAVADVVPSAEAGGGEAAAQEGEFCGVGEGLEARQVLEAEGDARGLEGGEEGVEGEGEGVEVAGGGLLAQGAFVLGEGEVGVAAGGAEGVFQARVIGLGAEEQAALAQGDAPAVHHDGLGPEGLRALERALGGANGGRALGLVERGEGENLRPQLRHPHGHWAEGVEAGDGEALGGEGALPGG